MGEWEIHTYMLCLEYKGQGPLGGTRHCREREHANQRLILLHQTGSVFLEVSVTQCWHSLTEFYSPLTGINGGCITAAHYDYCGFITWVTIAQIQMETEIIQDLICGRYVGNSLCCHNQIRSLIHPAYRCHTKIIGQSTTNRYQSSVKRLWWCYVAISITGFWALSII